MQAVFVAGLMAAAALAGSAAAQPIQQQPGVLVTGGGLAEACSKAAGAGESSPRFEQVCTVAIETESLAPLDRAGTYVNRGIIKLRGQRYVQAIADFDTAIRYKPDLAEAYVNRGAACIGAHRFADSVTNLDKALALGVREPEKAYYNRALAYEWLENAKAAYLDYTKAAELAPDWDLVKQQLQRFKVSHADGTPVTP
jgi:tetratricopeptide (TPR) repeat protein